MRISTAVLTAIVATSASALALSYAQDQQRSELALEPQGLTLTPSETPSEAALAPSGAASAEPSPTSVTDTNPSASEPASSGTNSASPTSSPSPDKAPVVIAKTSDPVDYKYGTVQIAVEKTDGKITKVDLVQADATKGRDSVYRDLVTATIKAQGTGYGNISGATFTVEAFKLAVESALGKF